MSDIEPRGMKRKCNNAKNAFNIQVSFFAILWKQFKF